MGNARKAKPGSAINHSATRWKKLFSIPVVVVILAAAGWVAEKSFFHSETVVRYGKPAASQVGFPDGSSYHGGCGYMTGAALAFGGIEKAVISSHGAKPVVPAESPPEIAVIIDDVGCETTIARKLVNLDSNLTFSVLPRAANTEKVRKWLSEAGRETMLHLPMQGSGYSARYLGKGALKLKMSPLLIKRIVDDDLAAVPEASGVNNHMGSRFTAWKPGMRAVLQKLKERGLYFVDSVTGSHTTAYDMARRMGLRCSKRDVFLDHDNSLPSVKRQWEKLLKKAKSNGKAVAIGHPRPNTYLVLKREIPMLKYKGIRLVPASYVVEALKGGA